MIPAGVNVAQFQYALGESRRAYFRLRRMSDGTYYNANTALTIYLALTHTETGFTLPPVYAVRESGFDDWLGGLVSVVFSANNVSATPGTYEGRLVVKGTDEEPAFTGVRVDVPNGPRMEPYTLPGIGTFTGPAYMAQTAGAVKPGTVVAATTTLGVTTIAPAADPVADTDVLGIAVSEAAAAGYAAAWVPTTSIMRFDWTDLAGTAQLLPSTTYRLDGVGSITPTGTGPIVGVSDDSGHTLVR